MNTIPKMIKHSDLLSALEPLFDLLGVTAMDVFETPGLHISPLEVTWAMPPGPQAKNGRRKRVLVREAGLEPLREEYEELMVFVRVKTDLAVEANLGALVSAAAAEGAARGKR
jgi:hypothetical protein